MAFDLEKLEAVFYSAPVPLSGHVVTFLGLVFDRVHFPNVYIPAAGFDPGEVTAEIERIRVLPKLRHQDHLLLSIMHFVTGAVTYGIDRTLGTVLREGPSFEMMICRRRAK